jgi:hypothetical protein
MWTSVRTKRVWISPRQRQWIETFARRAFQRELQHIGSVVVTLSPAKKGGVIGYTCGFRIWSHYLGLINVLDTGDTVRAAVHQAALRARQALRRRLHKRYDGARRVSLRQQPWAEYSRDQAGSQT